ncbi:glycosyltransferase family 4 protein [Cyanobium sp. To12R1]|uniref:glycosyltransferase family 4 protein n=1 Tax=Cyanobium sp. To12R1 TaxID=2823723 RepID=UPI0020CECFE4|nr:glycosyltransferase family 4 protein [Cyanobium sp. To12R1]MCP9781690.1 glycosyltransferase family 4 protein [Cyanobium sp. To12R1]
MRILVLLTDAYGGRGGIAQHNRHLLEALCSAPGVEEVVALPRVILDPIGRLPDRLTYRVEAAGAKWQYAGSVLRELAGSGRFDLVISGHLNLLPFAVLAKVRYGARLIQIVHGIEAWSDPGAFKRRLVRLVDRLVSVSDFTRRKVQAWASLSEEHTVVIPNCIDLSRYGPGPKRADLVAQYGLEGKKVIMTLSRLSASERYKGHDQILEVLADVVAHVPNVVYLIAGNGDDRPRLEAKARTLGLVDRVVFAGYVPEADKLDILRLADVFAMPGRGEGFGIVYLEALACGIPVVASSADASREAVLDGALGTIVDPDRPAELLSSLSTVINTPRSASGVGALATFSRSAFYTRWHGLVRSPTDE